MTKDYSCSGCGVKEGRYHIPGCRYDLGDDLPYFYAPPRHIEYGNDRPGEDTEQFEEPIQETRNIENWKWGIQFPTFQ